MAFSSIFFRMNIIAIVLISLICAPYRIESTANVPQTATETVLKKSYCILDRVFRLVGYDCSQMDLREIPQHLKSSVEVFDLSVNRIRELSKDSFKRYPNIKLLYLFDNTIQYIEDGTFAHLIKLEAIDLSINALSTISLELFKLPLLRNLYYNNNSLFYINKDLQSLEKPVSAPLQKINLSNCRLSSVPDFGILPELYHLNLSFNPLDQVAPQQFSSYCSLSVVVLENATDINPCTCQSLHVYFIRRNISLRDWFDCPTIHEENVYCTGSPNTTVDRPEFDQCMAKVIEKRRDEKSKETWLWIICSLGAFFVTFIFVLYLLHRRNVKKTEQLEKKSTKLRHVHQTSNGNVEVLLS